MAGEIDDFIMRHGMIRSVIDSEGLKGKCALTDQIKERVNVSDSELPYHFQLFDIDGYIAQPTENVSCSRDAIRLLSKRLTTALE